MAFNNNSMIIIIEPWFIPLDILMILCTTFAIGLALIFLIIIIFDKTCHTVPMLLIANSCLAELVFASDMLGMAIFTFENDLKQIQYENSLCIFRGFIGYIVTVLQNYSYLLQAIYRYITVVYPTRLSWQSARLQVLIICSTWIFGFIFAVPFVATGAIKYNLDNQICQVPLQLSFFAIYNVLLIYMIPISLIVLLYVKLVQYVQEMSKNITSVNILTRAQRELKMIRRIVILIIGIATIGFPYAIFVFISFFTRPPTYHFRIAYIFIDVSVAFVMVALFQFTKPLEIFVMKKMNWQTKRVIPKVG